MYTQHVSLQEAEAKTQLAAKAARIAANQAMPRRRSSRQELLDAKRAAKKEEIRQHSIEDLILSEEHRLREKKKHKRRDTATRKVLEHASSLEFELQQLIVLLQRTPRQKELMRQARNGLGVNAVPSKRSVVREAFGSFNDVLRSDRGQKLKEVCRFFKVRRLPCYPLCLLSLTYVPQDGCKEC